METWVPYALIFGTFAVLAAGSWVFLSKNNISDPRIFIAVGVTATFIFATLATFSLILGAATGHFTLDNTFMRWLGGATIGEIATMLSVILGWYFKGTDPLPPGTHKYQADPCPDPSAHDGKDATNT